jgi:hypothetical protein
MLATCSAHLASLRPFLGLRFRAATSKLIDSYFQVVAAGSGSDGSDNFLGGRFFFMKCLGNNDPNRMVG